MEKQYAILTVLGASILLTAAISTSFLPLQFASATGLTKPANPAGAPPGNITGGNMTGGNMTGGPSANTTGGPPATPPANPAGAPVCS
jgi:hypothetical protein